MPQLTVAELLALHPPPKPFAGKKRVERLWIFDVPGEPEALWPHIADTSRMNRVLELAPMTFTEVEGRRCGSSKPGGVQHEWVEHPWNWVANQWFTCVREYSKGFMTWMYAIQRLEKTATGTRLYLYFGGIPRSWFGSLAMKLGFPTIERAYRRVLPVLAQQLDRLRPPVLALPPPVLSDEALARIAKAKAQLADLALDRACIDALLGWITTGDDVDLARIQIRERARVWKVDEQELLRVALYATRAGLLTLSWDTVCPHCRGVRDENGSLAALQAHSACDTCQVTFETDKQETVEVTFRVHSAVRDIPDQVYCSAEPAKKDHIRVQRTLAPKQATTLEPNLGPGRYTVWANNMRGGWYLDVHEAGPDHVAWQPLPGGTIVEVGPGAKVEIANDVEEEQRFTIEEAKWSDHALRAGQLLSFQEFRDLFSEEYIGADVRLGVGEQTLLFTDVVGSTAFYALRGDPAAFVEIKRHFDEVFAIVTKHRGAVVKTIGDAVMATFTNPVDAVRASHAIHKAFSPTREDTPIRLRISLNTGPCIAVRLNANADFFGGTVNVAAKLQALAEGYQIAMSEATYASSGVAEFIAGEGATTEVMEYTSKALPSPVGVRRWTVFAVEGVE